MIKSSRRAVAGCAEAMSLVLEQPEYREALRMAAGKRMQEREWSWEEYARQFLSLCETSIGSRRG